MQDLAAESHHDHFASAVPCLLRHADRRCSARQGSSAFNRVPAFPEDPMAWGCHPAGLAKLLPRGGLHDGSPQ